MILLAAGDADVGIQVADAAGLATAIRAARDTVAAGYAEVAVVADQVAIVESATARQVIDTPIHPDTRALSAAVPEPEPANRFRRRATERWQDAPGSAIHPLCPHHGASVPPTLPEVAGEPGRLVACHVEPPHSR